MSASNPFDGAPLAPLPIRLTCLDGHLYLGGEPLIYFYPAGDVDCLPWPLVAEYRTPEELRDQLRRALQDEVETGHLPDGTQAVMLPDGTMFALYGSDLDAALDGPSGTPLAADRGGETRR